MIDINLRTFLLSQSSISSLIDGIYPLRLPQDSDGTNLVYEIGHGFPSVNAGSLHGLTRYNVTLNVFGSSYSNVRTASEALGNLLQGYTGPIHNAECAGSYFITQINLYEEDQSLYHTILTFDIHTN